MRDETVTKKNPKTTIRTADERSCPASAARAATARKMRQQQRADRARTVIGMSRSVRSWRAAGAARRSSFTLSRNDETIVGSVVPG